MDYAEYVKRLSFRFIKPETRLPLSDSYFETRLSKILTRGGMGFPEKFGAMFDLLNTKYPEDSRATREKMKRLGDVPRMSTTALGAMINKGVAEMKPDEAFINIGVWFGFTFFSGLLGNGSKRCVAIDNFSQFGGPKQRFVERLKLFGTGNHHFYDVDYAEYIQKIHSGPIGFYIYDGPHDYENQLKGLRLAEPFFGPKCVIMVDDTNWREPREATYDFIASSKMKYEVLLDVATVQNCHPTYWNGVILFRVNGPDPPDQS